MENRLIQERAQIRKGFNQAAAQVGEELTSGKEPDVSYWLLKDRAERLFHLDELIEVRTEQEQHDRLTFKQRFYALEKRFFDVRRNALKKAFHKAADQVKEEMNDNKEPTVSLWMMMYNAERLFKLDEQISPDNTLIDKERFLKEVDIFRERYIELLCQCSNPDFGKSQTKGNKSPDYYQTRQQEKMERITSVISNIKSSGLFKIKFAPLDVPRHRRLETLAALIWILMPFIFGPLCWITIIYLIANTTTVRYFAIAYLMWMYLDKETCERGGRRWDWFRRLGIWQYFKNYFPVKLVTTTPLPADKNYLFAVFPHGILCSGAFSAFGTDAHNLEEVMPGIKPHVCTLKINFDMPILREVGLACGMVAASKESLNSVLGKPGTGRAAVLMVGGAAEALNNNPGVYRIVLESRKGFCRIALENGSPLVPVFSFGEIDLYDQYIPQEGSWFQKAQAWVKRKTGIVPVVVAGRGIFTYNLGLIPKRRPVIVVVGKPIEVEKIEHPTREDVDKLHQRFKEGLTKLFETEKHKYLENPETKLIIT